MKTPDRISEIGLDMSITTGVTRDFVMINVHVDIYSTFVNTTKCSGLFCNRQRSVEIESGNRGCGCYYMTSRIGNIVIVHNVRISKDGEPLLEVEDFSSLNFRNLYLKTPLSSSVRFNLLDFTPLYWRLQTFVDDFIKFLNDNGGFTVVGWYKNG